MSTLLSSRCYGNRQSLAARQRERLAMCFESYEEAKRRCETSQKAGNEKRSPIGNFENMQWDKQALLEEVNSYADGTVINWSALARQYQVKNKNGELAITADKSFRSTSSPKVWTFQNLKRGASKKMKVVVSEKR